MAEYLLDTGPLVAALCHQDRWHGWARSALPELRGSFLTCDAVATDAAHLLRNSPGGVDGMLAMLATGDLVVEHVVPEELPAIHALLTAYAPRMSLADACLVRMSELHPSACVITTDKDFRFYRRNRRQVIPFLAPFGK